MTTAVDKAKVSAIAGLFGSIAAIFYGYANYTVIAGLATFVFVLMVQYSSFKFKIVASLITILGLISLALSHNTGGH